MEEFSGEGFHPNAVAVNSGRSGLAFLIENYNIKRIAIPDYVCESIPDICREYGVSVRYYEVDQHLRAPKDIFASDDEWLYVINYFGQISDDELSAMVKAHERLILDFAQAFYSQVPDSSNSLFTCRKYFGVPDGGYVYSATENPREALLPSQSWDRFTHLLGRYEQEASLHYQASSDNEAAIAQLGLQGMSPLTTNLLRAVDYEKIAAQRSANFKILDERLGHRNKLSPILTRGPFSYPLLVEDGAQLRAFCHSQKIYVPSLWPNVLESDLSGACALDFAANLLPLPIDQRYSERDMNYIADIIEDYLDAK